MCVSPCELGKLTWDEILLRCPQLQEYPQLTRWGWHNRDYTKMDTYASTNLPSPPGGEIPAGTVPTPWGVDLEVWHFQDDCVSGELSIDMDMASGEHTVNQYSWFEEYYKHAWPLCPITDPATGVDGPPAIEDFSKDLAFELYTTEDQPPEDLDFGDAPDPAVAAGYPTRLANNGARHIIVSGAPWLGDTTDGPDADPDGQEDPAALGDDNDILTPATPNDDEDGVQIPNPLILGQPATIQFEVNGAPVGGPPAIVEGWIDYDGDQVWGSMAVEQIVSGPYNNGIYPRQCHTPGWLCYWTDFCSI